MSYFTKNLKDNEELIRQVRQHALAFGGRWLVSLCLLLLPFFLLFLLFRWQSYGPIIFVILVIIGLWSLIRLLVVKYFNCLLVTNQRVILIKQKGFFDRQVMEVEYQKIQDVSYHYQGMFQTVFHYGNLKIQVLSSETVIKAEKIPQPEQIQDLIKNIQKNQAIQSENLSAESLVKLAQVLKDKLGPDRLRKIIDDSK
jgi:hypothetical protein